MSRRFLSHRPKPARSLRVETSPVPAAKPPRGPAAERPGAEPGRAKEIGGPSGPEPTRYGDWERGGLCVDF